MRIFTEGDLDRVVVEDIQSLSGLKSEVYPKKGARTYFGKSGALGVFLVELKRGSPAALVLDLDEKNADDSLESVKRTIASKFEIILQQQNEFTLNTKQGRPTSKVAFAGLPEDAFIQGLGITKHEMEDYLLKIVLGDEDVYNLLRAKGDFSEKHIKLEDCRGKIQTILEHFEKQKITVSSRKVFDILKAIVGFHGSPATFAETILKRTPDEAKRDVFSNLLEALT